MTEKQALKIAADCIAECMKPLAFDANVAMKDLNASEGMKNRAKKYAKLGAALLIIEDIGRQGRLL